MTWINEPGTAPFPGSCLMCGTNKRQIINFPITQAWNGAMLLCTECLTAAVDEHKEILGWTRTKDHSEMVHDLDAKLRVAQQKNALIDDTTTELMRKINDAHVNFNNSLYGIVPKSHVGAGSGSNPVDEILKSIEKND